LSNVRKLDAEWLETDCPLCGHVYLWHVEERNQCTKCDADYGPLITDLAAHFKKVREEI